MPDLNNTKLITFNNWTLRVRESTDPAPLFLLLIHGLTGDENSMWVCAQDLPKNYWIVAPRAPNVAPDGQGGYSWRLPQYENLNDLSLDELRAASEGLIHLVDEYSGSVGVDASLFDVMGFSQGAAMSNTLAFLYPQRIRKVGILAGFVPHAVEEIVSQRPLEGKPIFVAHGTKDQMVSIERARASIKVLESAGAYVNYCEDEVGHKLSVTCLRAMKKFFSKRSEDPAIGRAD